MSVRDLDQGDRTIYEVLVNECPQVGGLVVDWITSTHRRRRNFKFQVECRDLVLNILSSVTTRPRV